MGVCCLSPSRYVVSRRSLPYAAREALGFSCRKHSLRLARATDSLVRLSGRGGQSSGRGDPNSFLCPQPLFRRAQIHSFANLDPDSSEARCFVALEDWINDKVPLSIRVARSCAFLACRPTSASPGSVPTNPCCCPRSRPDCSSMLGRTACGSFRRRDTPAAAARPCRNDGSHTRTRCVVDTHRKLVARPVERSLNGRASLDSRQPHPYIRDPRDLVRARRSSDD